MDNEQIANASNPSLVINTKALFKLSSVVRFITLNEKEKTIGRIISKRGYSAKNKRAEIRFEPAMESEGINFVVRNTIIPVSYKYLCANDKHTTILKNESYEIEYVEHVLAAIYGLGISNIKIYLLDNCQIPMLEGSCYDYVSILLKAGIKIQRKRKIGIKILRPFTIKENNLSYIKVLPPKDNKLIVHAFIDYGKPIGRQKISYLHSSQMFCLEIAWARTFAFNEFKNIMTTLKKYPGFKLIDGNGLPQPNMIIYKNRKYLLPIRRKDEEVRHKILDFLGDVAITGFTVIGEFYLVRSGHKVNHKLGFHISKEIMQEKIRNTCPRIYRTVLYTPKHKYRSRFIKEVTIPDGKAVSVNSTFIKIWEIQNVGTMPWSNICLKREGLNYGPGRLISKKIIKISDAFPGEIIKIKIFLKAPKVPGSYYSAWKIINKNGEYLFPKQKPLTVTIDVVYARDLPRW